MKETFISFRAVAAITIQIIIFCSLLYAPGIRAAEANLTVLINANIQNAGIQYVNLLRRFSKEVGGDFTFETRILEQEEIEKIEQNNDWTIAILSPEDIDKLSKTDAAPVFQMPFFYSTFEALKNEQNGDFGRAYLSELLEADLVGLSFLNSDVRYLAGVRSWDSLEDLNGAKILVRSPYEVMTSKALGSAGVRENSSDFVNAITKGSAEGAVIGLNDSEFISELGGGQIVSNIVGTELSIVAANKEAWEKLPFTTRARVSDSAMLASEAFDASLAASEKRFQTQAMEMGFKFQSFSDSNVGVFTSRWVSENGAEHREGINEFLDYKKKLLNSQYKSQGDFDHSSSSAEHIFFATTREKTNEKRLRYRYGDARTNVIKCGKISFDARNLDGYINEEFASKRCDLYAKEIRSLDGDILIFVHGFNNRFSDAVKTARFIRSGLSAKTTLILWSWPSKKEALGANYDYDKESATGISSNRFADFIEILSKARSDGKLNIIAHSMGAWHTSKTLSNIDHRGIGDGTLDYLIFAAPDVPTDEFSFLLEEFQNKFQIKTLYACEADRALRISKRINKHDRAGTGGDDSIIVQKNIESIDVDGRLLSTNHSYVFQPGSVFDDFRKIIEDGARADIRRLPKVRKGNHHYWRIE